MPHPLHANRPADLLGQERRLEARVIGGRAAVPLRSFHPDDAHLFPRHLEKLGDAVPQTVGFHVVGIDRHLAVRRIGHGMGRTDAPCGPGTGHRIRLRRPSPRPPAPRRGSRPRSALGLDVGVALRMYLYRFSEVGKGGVAGFCQLTLSCLAALIACSSRSQTTAT